MNSLIYHILTYDHFKKDIYVKKTIDQIRFPIKEILTLKHFTSIFYHDFRSLLWVRNRSSPSEVFLGKTAANLQENTHAEV